MKRVTIYTDGSAWPNPGPGSWAALLEFADQTKEISGKHPEPTTNNRMEIQAAIEALRFLGEPFSVTLRTDSQYLKNSASNWMFNWHRKGWRNKFGFVKNHDLWMQIWDLCGKHNIIWEWVRGHDKCAQNNRCDYLAEQARLKT